MLKVGLTGGIASGKSFVAEIFRECGAKLVDADSISRDVVKKGKKAYNNIVSHFGKIILDDTLEIDRNKLGSIVFNNPEELKNLNSITHPEIVRREDEICQKIANENPKSIIIVNAALLIEAGSYRRFKKLILVYVSLETQFRRLIERDGLSMPDIRSRINSQMSFEEKRKFADYIIDNDGDVESTRIQCEKIYEALLEINLSFI